MSTHHQNLLILNRGGWTYVNSSMAIEKTGIVSYSLDKKNVTIFASQTNGSSNHKGGGSLFSTPIFKQLVINQIEGSLDYLCASVQWNSAISLGGYSLSLNPFDYYYPGWIANNKQDSFYISANNINISKTYTTYLSKISYGVGGFSGCSIYTHAASIKIR